MATYSRVKTWSSNETLTSSDLNAEFNNIITNTNSGNLNSDNVSTSATWTCTGTHTMSTSSKLAIIDNLSVTVASATDGDYFIRYNASNTALELSTTNADGSGTNAVVLDIQDGTDDVRVRGGLSTNNATAPTTGIKTGGPVISDTTNTDALGSASVTWSDLYLGDSAVLAFGEDQDVTLTHDPDDGIFLNAGMKLAFRDMGGEYIYSVSDGTLGIAAATEVAGTTTPLDLNGVLDVSGNATVGGTLGVTGVGTFTAQSVHTGGIQSGSNIVSDTDSTDDLRTTSVRWANVYTDAVGDSGQTLGVKATTLSFDAASTIDTSGNNALTLDAGSAVLTLDGGTLESDASTFSFDAAATIDTSGNNNLTLNAGTGTLVATAGDMTLFDDNNDADVSLSMGTSATEALVIQALNGGSNKTLEELRFTTKTASDTGDHGKVSFHIDEEEIATIDDGGIDLASGKSFTVNGSALSSGISWDGSTPNGVATYKDGDEATVEANLTFDGSTLTVTADQHIANGNGLVIGHTSQVAANGVTAETQILGTSAADSAIIHGRWSADAASPLFYFIKSRAGSIGASAHSDNAADDGDRLGQIIWCVDDGTDYQHDGARIWAEAEGNAASNNIPTSLHFGTCPSGASTITERLVIDASGDATISDGDLVIGTSGHGIDFSATSDAGGATSEVLDNYEIGTFTPTLGAHSSNGTHSYTTQVGNYTRVGNVVHIWMQMTINTLNTSGTISGNLEISGLPYTSANTTGQAYMGTFLSVGLDMDSGTGPVAHVSPNATKISLIASVDNASYDTFTSADVASGDGFWIQVSYPV